MKSFSLIIFLILALSFTSCEDFLTHEDPLAISANDAYSSTMGINSIVANLVFRLRYEQDFMFNGSFYNNGLNSSRNQDMARWDETIFNHPSQWQHPGATQNNSYRQYYDYGLIRALNIHLKSLREVSTVDEIQKKYYIAEARYYRAWTYFQMVFRVGGVPLIGDVVYEYTDNPSQYALKRNKEEEVYDYILSELDAITEDISAGKSLTRPGKGAVLALKCRVMLYAGTIAYNDEKNAQKGLKLPSGAVGISSTKASVYLQECLDAYTDLKNMGTYSLYTGNSDLASNFYELFIKKTGNPELILIKDYDGVNFQNDFTQANIPRSQQTQTYGGLQNPLLNLVECFEDVNTKTVSALDAYVGAEQVESMDNVSSTYAYQVYNAPEDIFIGRDPRLKGSILYPGSTFRGKPLDLQAGIAEKTATGYTFRNVDAIENVNNASNLFNGIRMTGVDGPHKVSGYCTHTGFYIRKFMDPTAGSESAGKSTIAYPIFRYGEVLLNAAEAAWYLDQKALALQIINQIRKRAGGAAFELTLGELTLDKIMNERRVELAFEDHRFNDVKRWRIADEIWSNQRSNPSSLTYAFWPYRIYAPGDPSDGKYLYRKLLVQHRGVDGDKGMPINFGLGMYYATYPQDDGNKLIEPNPNQ